MFSPLRGTRFHSRHHKNDFAKVKRPGRHTLQIERLEHRLLLANDPIVVDTAEDIIADDGVTSLREAIIKANETDGADVIQFAEFRGNQPLKLGISGTDEDEAATGDLDITDDLTIEGRGAEKTIIDADGFDRVLDLHGEITVSISGVTITGGEANTDDTYNGGGIRNRSGSLSIFDSQITGNTASFYGGAILNGGTINHISRSIISGNTALRSGGAIFNYGTIGSISQSTISGNTASREAGGAIANLSEIENISQTTFSDNYAFYGASVINNEGAIISISQSTISENTAFSGGAIINDGSIGSISQTTFSGNMSNSGEAIINGGSIGSISQSTIAGDLLNPGIAISQSSEATIGSLENTIITGNRMIGRFREPDIRGGAILNATNNLIGASYGQIISDGVDGNIVGVAPMLGPLADNGGPTLTHALLPGSPAIDAGTNPDMLEFDQRGQPFARTLGAAPDIGAVEFRPLRPIIVDTQQDAIADDGVTSLREAILEANATFGNDIIMFAEWLSPSHFTLGIKGSDEDAAASGDLDITDDLMIVGHGLGDTIIDGGGIDRVFDIHGDITVTISRVTIQGGQVDEFDGSGGGIRNQSTSLSIVDSEISGNTAGYTGGAILNQGTITSINRSTIWGNTAFHTGGAIENHGTIESISQTSFSNNTASNAAGAIKNHGTIDVISSSTFSENSASHTGGAIQNDGLIGIIREITFSGNTAPQGGRAIENYAFIGSISQSTITGNSPNQSTAVLQHSNATIGRLENTIIASDTVTVEPRAMDLRGGTIIDAFNNLIGVSQGHTIVNGVDGNIVGSDPLLGPLADNGGPTLTHTLLPGSPAIDAGSFSITRVFDQRGAPFVRTFGDTADIGAVELQPPGTPIIVDTQSDTIADDGATSLREAIIAANASAGPDIIMFAEGLNGRHITLTIEGSGENAAISGDLDITDDLIVAGRGTDDTIIDGGGIDRVFDIHGDIFVTITDVTIQGGRIKRGAGIRNEAARLSILESKITKNRADHNGGAIENLGTIEIISETLISDNSSRNGGGAIRNDGSIREINRSTLSNNWTYQGGGAIENFGTIEIISGIMFAGNSSSFGGGAIRNKGSIRDINQSTFSENRANHSGGAIENRSTIDAISQSMFSINWARSDGGAIVNYGTITSISQTTISENITASDGGALSNGSTIGIIEQTTFSENQTVRGGSAIQNDGLIEIISQVTMSGNTASSGVGAIHNRGRIGSIAQGTITSNSGPVGGGIYQDTMGSIGRIYNTIIASNGDGFDLVEFGNITIAFNNLIGSSGGHTIRDDIDGNIVDVDPMLGPLADNGGPTLTHALLPGSPAIDAGNNRLKLEFDQRGEPFVRKFGGIIDIGAFELQPDPVVVEPLTEQDLRAAILSSVGDPVYQVELDFDGSGFIDIRDVQMLRRNRFNPKAVLATLGSELPGDDLIMPASDAHARRASRHKAHEQVFASLADGELTPLLPASWL